MYYGQENNVSYTSQRIDKFEARSIVIFNCTIYDNNVIVKECLNVIYCVYDNFGGNVCSKHEYLISIESNRTHDSNNEYFIVEYYWYNYHGCELLITFTVMPLTFLIVGFCFCIIYFILDGVDIKKQRIKKKYSI